MGCLMDWTYFTVMFTVETYHRPLVFMLPRIHRLVMKLQRYDLELIHTSGKYLVLAHALSRAPEMGHMSFTEKEVEDHVNMIVESLPVSDAKSKQISEETAKDKELQTVMEHIRGGWPKGSCPKYHRVRSQLSEANGLLLRDNWIVIPHSMRHDTLQRIREGHLGIKQCQRRARDTVYWPGINKD